MSTSYGRLFDIESSFSPSIESLVELARSMRDEKFEEKELDSPDDSGVPLIPAGYTYFGQFVAHDISHDSTPLPDGPVDVATLENKRAAVHDLESVYGSADGPEGLYDPGGKLVVGKARKTNNLEPLIDHDLYRPHEAQKALIGDHRNDENLVVAQLHVAFVNFHNRMLGKLSGDENETLLEKTQRTVRWHYQYLMVNDFLPRIVTRELVDTVLNDGPIFFPKGDSAPFMPIEFSHAAYRFGHSMVREIYQHNDVVRTLWTHRDLKRGETELHDLLRITGEHIPSHTPIRRDWVVNWNRYFHFPGSSKKVNPSRRIDPFIVPKMYELRGFGHTKDRPALPERTLIRGQRLGLPSGQEVARHMRKWLPDLPVLEPEQISSDESGQPTRDGAAAKAHEFDKNAPLWYYVLKEAQVLENGERLGPVGARIVAETLLGLLLADKTSYIKKSANEWPFSLIDSEGFMMSDFINFAYASYEDPNAGVRV